MENRFSKITIRESRQEKIVQISSKLKPEIIFSIIEKWQSLLNLTAKIVDIPSGLIMRLNEKTIEVFLKSQTEGNPYEVGEQAELIYGLYCETVIGTQKKLLVPDATKSPIWKNNNPDVEINMISYLGYPINWPDGEVFGTICLLDNKENYFNGNYSELLNQIKQHIEADLQLIVSKQELERKNKELKQLNNIKSRFLSLISHDVRGGIGTLDEFLKLIISEIDDYDKSKLKTTLESLSQSTNTAYLTLENLLNWSKNDLLQLEADKKQVNIIEVIENLLLYFQQAIEIKNIEIIKDYYTDKIHIYADENMMNTSIRNILSNAIKYNNSNGKIFIRIIKKGKQNVIEIEDTGIGMNKKAISNLFSYSKSHQTKGTKGESSAGLGLFLTKDFLDKNSATVRVNSEIGKGTKFRITI